MKYTIHPLGDSAVLIDFQEADSKDTLNTITALTQALAENQHEAVLEAVPAYKTVTVHYNPLKIHSHLPYVIIKDFLLDKIEGLQPDEDSLTNEVITIPVLYGDEAGPDLSLVAEHNNLTEEKVIELHSEPVYSVAFLGFSPGFPFLKGMDSSIAVPRRKTPRVRIDAGSVGIAGYQTGVYPISSPGGWQIIGKTPLKLFDPDNRNQPALLSQGDKVRFSSITKAEYERLEGS
ncbi:5-oxoprolinase subunit PxpB [Bacillus sp. SCS-153A]|uniref:5-oxoprolinase subunit PxpB n=1 Tax=Rossellomorea sedimentorum TaxID=3115294 RepID=UPI003906A4BD